MKDTMTDFTLYSCDICGNLAFMLENSGAVPSCCGSEMDKLTANTVDASVEKHVPVVHAIGCHISVMIGEQKHPMTYDHFIKWIAVHTDKSTYFRKLSVGDLPFAEFVINNDETPVAVYAFCNLHGLWCKEV